MPDGYTWGCEVPPFTTQAIPWNVWTVINTMTPARYDSDWGNLLLEAMDSFVGNINDTGNTRSKRLTVTYDDCNVGSGTPGQIFWRGSDTAFLQSDVLPEWVEYNGPIYTSFRFLQLRIDGSGISDNSSSSSSSSQSNSSASVSSDSSSSSSSSFPEIILNPGDNYILPSSELRGASFRYTGVPGTTATVELWDGTQYISFVVENDLATGYFEWDANNAQGNYHIFTTYPEAWPQALGIRLYSIIYTGPGSLKFSIHLVDNLSTSSSSSSASSLSVSSDSSDSSDSSSSSSSSESSSMSSISSLSSVSPGASESSDSSISSDSSDSSLSSFSSQSVSSDSSMSESSLSSLSSESESSDSSSSSSSDSSISSDSSDSSLSVSSESSMSESSLSSESSESLSSDSSSSSFSDSSISSFSSQSVSSQSSDSTVGRTSSSSSSSSAFNICPNNVYSITADIVTSGTMTYDAMLTVNETANMGKDHFLKLYSGDTTGKTASNQIFFGDTTTEPTSLVHFITINVNGSEYYMPVYAGAATSGCASTLTGEISN